MGIPQLLALSLAISIGIGTPIGAWLYRKVKKKV